VLRIHRETRDDEPRLVLEGKLAGPWVAECRALLAEAARQGGAPALDAREVHFADAEGLALLAELDAAGRLRARSRFLAARLARKEES